MRWKVGLLLSLIAGIGFWFLRVPAGPSATGDLATVDRPHARPQPLAVESGFRAGIEAALKLPHAESHAEIDRVIGLWAGRVGARDAAWFLEKCLSEYPRGMPSMRKERWLAVLKDLASRRPLEAGLLLERKDRLGEDDGSVLMREWAAKSPREALSWGKQGDDKRARWLMLHGHILTLAWAAQDLDGLLAWLQLGNNDVQAGAAMRAFMELRGIAAVREWLETFGGEGSTLSMFVRMAAAELVAAEIQAGEGRQAVMSWVESREDPVERWQALQQVLPRMVAREPRETVEWLERLSPQEGFPDWLAETSMNEWAAQDLKAAGEWLNRHRGSAAVDSYIWGYAVQLAIADPEAALEWSKELKGGIDGGSGFIASGDVNVGPHYNAEYLEQIIAVTASAVAYLEDPDHPGVALDQRLALRYMPQLIRESPGAEPQIRMVRSPPLACTLFFDGMWRHSFPVYERQPDGSLRYVQSAEGER
jgi:hypothetical protein